MRQGNDPKNSEVRERERLWDLRITVDDLMQGRIGLIRGAGEFRSGSIPSKLQNGAVDRKPRCSLSGRRFHSV